MSANPPTRDRRQLLLAPGALLNGIGYIDVARSQTRLFVHFLNTVAVRGSLAGTAPVTITGGEIVTGITVNPIDEATAWSADSQGRPVLAVTVAVPGDFSTYLLGISSDKLDPFLSQAPFAFRADSPSLLDCRAPAPSCPEPEPEPVTIDYLAKDFASFQQALSEFSAQRYPAWVERSEADLGVMLMEALAAMADELSYYQDRVLAESTLQTATQRLSVIRLARLVDYEPAPATAATAILQLDVSDPAAGSPLQAPTSWKIDTSSPPRVRALGADGAVVDFEIEDPAAGLAGAARADPPAWATVDTRWNRASLRPYYWDDSRRCLHAGSADFYVAGHGLGLYPGQQLLLDTAAADSADPPVRELVTVSATEETSDPLIGDPPPTQLTHVFLQAPTTDDHDLASTTVAGNIVPAVQGLRQSETFEIPDPAAPPPGPVVVRVRANWTPQHPLPDYRYCLASGPLAWLATTGPDALLPALPEIVLSELTADAGTPPWTYEHWLLDAGPADQVFTLTPEQYSPVLTSNAVTWYDYDGDGGTTIRFGDGTFGMSPRPGTKFSVVYRVGGGSAGNVPADAITNVAPGQGSMIDSCTNPFPAAGGTDAETLQQVRDRAPQKFSAEPLRAVLPGDYQSAAQSLPWVQQASVAFRWTGSWLTVLTRADPAGTEEPTIAQLQSLTGLLDERRLAGYESFVLAPSYVSVDLRITVRARPGYFGRDVAAAVLARLQPGTLRGGAAGFFDHSRWSFGEPLESSALLATIQSCPGVDGVDQVEHRKRGAWLDWAPLPARLRVGPGQILRVDNDPARPEAGSLRIEVRAAK
jgi:Baseplate J-like protein